MTRSAVLFTVAMLVAGCTSTQPAASIAESGMISCADQAVWGHIVANTDGHATIRTDRWLVPDTGAADLKAAITEPVGAHGLLVVTAEETSWFPDELGLRFEDAWEQDGRHHDPGCDDNPQG
ncbi:hypothetical protein M1L60_27295 [Actinoplanes sp. TRM 88003]|uniref:Lipoprotein n=1 Tax=Paractinoplanes aksuensis TaxID=2939490 RepID=A0ABT1DW67_9ACTN|nr:hypothetical protein [Actinoplanes aksuensis]MCO8274311.1 hypothetical protein [Actinoplanes aksuensis]